MLYAESDYRQADLVKETTEKD